jgi:hypothetical protein
MQASSISTVVNRQMNPLPAQTGWTPANEARRQAQMAAARGRLANLSAKYPKVYGASRKNRNDKSRKNRTRKNRTTKTRTRKNRTRKNRTRKNHRN